MWWLGRLGTSLAGGKIMLDPALAAAAVDEVAASFGLTREAAADAIIASPTPICRMPSA